MAAALLDLAVRGRRIPEGAIIDPACGDGAFLRAASAANALPGRGCQGVDIDLDVVLCGLQGASLLHGDGLFEPSAEGTFAGAVGNPPFAGDGMRARSPEDRQRIARRFTIQHGTGATRGMSSTKADPLRTANVATFFLERFVRLVGPGGFVLIVLPASMLSNGKDAAARRWVLRHAEVLSVVRLAPGTFSASGTAAATAALVLVRRAVPVDECPAGEPAVRIEGEGMAGSVPAAQLWSEPRWDPPWLLSTEDDPMSGCRLPVEPLGAFIDHLQYGGIVTGRTPTLDHEGPWYVTQRAVTDRGVDLSRCVRIAPGLPYDRPSWRLVDGDLVVPRCGAGTLGKNRLTRFDGHEPAVVDCFCDILRLRGVGSAWVLGFLRSPAGWAQIKRRIHGVGTPNLRFDDLRALRIPVPERDQADAAERCWGEIRLGRQPFAALVALVEDAAFGKR